MERVGGSESPGKVERRILTVCDVILADIWLVTPPNILLQSRVIVVSHEWSVLNAQKEA